MGRPVPGGTGRPSGLVRVTEAGSSVHRRCGELLQDGRRRLPQSVDRASHQYHGVGSDIRNVESGELDAQAVCRGGDFL
ncbi:MAG TPA: hypothetical protein VFS14_04440, partial [Candidatus Saccharimonadales bacterium]|nr:hypothetical protein [Candidatus Saccharimonadales bacterium]